MMRCGVAAQEYSKYKMQRHLHSTARGHDQEFLVCWLVLAVLFTRKTSQLNCFSVHLQQSQPCNIYLQGALLFYSYYKCSESNSFSSSFTLLFYLSPHFGYQYHSSPVAQTRVLEVELASSHHPHHTNFSSTFLIFLQSFFNF